MANQIDFIVNGLQVTTNAVIGTYAMTNAAPINGLIVSGDVGIGTAAPTSKLEVVGNIQITNAAGVISGIRFADGTYQATSAANFYTPPGGNQGSIQFNDGGAFGGLSNVVIHTGNAHVGIGTNKADYALSVYANDGPALFATQNGTDYQIFVGDNDPSGNVAVLGFSESGQYAYLTTGNNQPTPVLVATQNGLIGIGTSTPVNVLDVSGGIVVGTAYAGNVVAPINGISVQGNLAVGSASTSARLGVVPSDSQNALELSSVSSGSFYIRAVDSAGQNKFLLNANGNITVGGWQGNVITANYGGTGLTTYTTGDILYASSSSTTLSKLGMTAANTGNVLLSNGTAPYWGNISLSSGGTLVGVLPVSMGGTNSTSFSGSAIVVTASDGLSMTGVTSATNAAVVFDGTGVPTSVTGGPYTYLTTGAGGGSLSFGKIDLVNGVTGTLAAGNGGTGLSTFGQYSLLYANTANNWAALGSTNTSALVTSATGAPQWTSGATANRVLRTDGTSITFSQVALTTDVTGVLPLANGGTNAALTAAAGAVVYSTASALALTNPSALYWDNTSGRLGIGTNAPAASLDVNGNVIIRNGANVVAGGLYVQSGDANIVNKLTAQILVSNSTISASDAITAGAIYSNSVIRGGDIQSNSTITSNAFVANLTVAINGTDASTSTTSGALTVAGGVGIGGNLHVGGSTSLTGNVTITGNLNVLGNVTTIHTDNLSVEDPLIQIGTGPNGSPLTSDDGQDRGLLMHYYSGVDNHAYLGREEDSGRLLFINNVQPGSTNIANPIRANSVGYEWGTAQLGNIVLSGNTLSTSSSTGVLVIEGPGGAGIGGALHVGTYAYVASGFNTGGTATVNALVSNTGISASTVSASGQITGGSIVSNSSVVASTITANTSVQVNGPITSTGTITANVLVANSAIYAPGLSVGDVFTANVIIANISLSSSGPISAAGAITGASLTSNSFINGTSINSSGPISAAGTGTFASIVSNSYVNGASLYSSGPISAVGTITGAALVSNSSVTATSAQINGTATATGNFVGDRLIANSSISSGGPISAAGTITGAVLVANTGVSTSGTVSAGGQITGGSIVSNSTVTGNVITANSAVSTLALDASGSVRFTSGNTTTSSTTGALVVTGGIATGNNLFVAGSTWTGNISVLNATPSTGTTTGALVVAGGVGVAGDVYIGGVLDAQSIQGTAIGNITPSTGQFTTLQSQNTATVNALISNSFINGTSLYSSGPISAVGTITGAALVSNGTVSGTSLYASGTVNTGGNATFANVTSNGFVNGASVYSSGAISAVGTITGANIISNAAIVGSTVQGSTSMLTGTFVANTSVTTQSLTASGTATVNSLVTNTSVTGNTFILNGNVATTSTTGSLTLDTFAASEYRTTHYLIQVTDNTASEYHSTQILLIHNGTTVFQSEYNIIYTNAVLGTFDSSIVGGQVALTFTASSATNKTIKVLRTAIEV
jgi:hypothetical protein